MGRFNIFNRGGDGPPAPEDASAEDVEQYNMAYAKAHGVIPEFGADATGPESMGKDATPGQENVKHRSEFPWLFDPSRGVRWDFDPIQLRNISQTNTWVNMLVSTITKEIAETPWTIAKADGATETQKRLSTHPDERTPVSKDLPDDTAAEIHDLLMHPNPDETWHDLVEQWYADLLEVGSMVGVKSFHRSAYDDEELTGNPRQYKPRALKATAPEVWTKDIDKTGITNGYWQFENHAAPGSGNPDGAQTSVRGIRDPTRFKTSEIMWDDMNPRSNRRYGIPPTLAVREFLESVDLAISQEQQYLSRGSLPSGAAVFEEWDREELREWNEQNQENITGKPWKWLTIAGKGGDFKFEPFSYNFSEMQYEERMKWYARVIASVFQVPTAVVGIEPERVNYNTFQGERSNFESNTLGPYLQQGERWLTHNFIKPHWGPDYRFEFMPGLSESSRGMISDRVRSEFTAGIRRRNEARRELGLDPVDEEFDGFQDEVVADTSPEDAEDALGDLVANQINSREHTTKAAFDPGDAVTYRWQGERYHGRIAGPPSDSVQPPGMPSPVTGDDGEPVYPIHQWDVDEEAFLAIEGEGNTAKPESLLAGSTEPLPDLSEADVINVDQPQTAKAEYEVGGETIDITPPEYMVAAAEAGSEAENDPDVSGDCGTGVGDRRADQIIGDEVGPEVLREIAAYLTSHEEDVIAEGTPSGWTDEEMSDCGNRQYAKWGGTGDGRAKEWAQGKVNELDRINDTELTYPEANSAGDSGNANESVRKDEPLRSSDEWYNFVMQPNDVEPLAEEIAGDVSALFDDVLADEEIQDIIDRLATDETEKTLGALSRRLREIFEESEIVARIQDALRDGTADMVEDSLEAALADAGEVDTEVDIEAIREQLRDRSVEFADSFANDISEDIRETVGDGWSEGKSSREIAEDISAQADMNEGWTGAERIARQEMHVAAAEARNEVAQELDKVEVWQTSQDNRVRPAHEEMQGLWKFPGDDFVVSYEGSSVRNESVPGDSKDGIGCRCQTLLRNREDVDDADYAGDGAL